MCGVGRGYGLLIFGYGRSSCGFWDVACENGGPRVVSLVDVGENLHGIIARIVSILVTAFNGMDT
jgi:hypothetical protein